MKKGFSFFIFSLLLPLSQFSTYAAPNSGACSPEATNFLRQADTAYLNRLDAVQADLSLELYDKAASADGACAEALWKGSRAAWWVADHASSRSEKILTFQKGIDLSKKAVELAPQSAEAHFWLAGNYGSYGETKGVLKSLFLLKPIRQELRKVLEINPQYDGGGAYRVLGVVDYKVPGFAGGSRKRALEELNKAAQIDPNNFFTRYYLAEYFYVSGNKGKAKEQLALLMARKPSAEEKPDLTMMQEKGAALLSKIH